MKWTQKDVEKLTGIKAGHISSIEIGARDPKEETVQKLCKGLKINEQYFYLEDSRLPADILPSMPPALESFIADGKNIPWLVLTEKAKRDGVHGRRGEVARIGKTHLTDRQSCGLKMLCIYPTPHSN